jgi:membrane fusion protein (multidrug efflux system)
MLRNGATGTLQIPYRSDSSLVVPKSATYEVQDKRFVYRVTDSSTVESVEIRTSARSTARLFVVEAGLSASDRIVTEGIGSIDDGTTIRPRPVAADSLYRVLAPEDDSAPDA